MTEATAHRAEADFPHAPTGWTVAEGRKTADALGITMGPEHWEIVLCLQEFFARNEFPARRELNDALEEFWHLRGGRRALYILFPGGPVAQGCAIGGLEVPAGSVDKSFGSVV